MHKVLVVLMSLLLVLSACSDDDAPMEAGIVLNAGSETLHLYSGGWGTSGVAYCNTVSQGGIPVFRGVAAKTVFYMSASEWAVPRVELAVSGEPSAGTNYLFDGSLSNRILIADGSSNIMAVTNGSLVFSGVSGTDGYCLGQFSGYAGVVSGSFSLQTNYLTGRFKLIRIQQNSWGGLD